MMKRLILIVFIFFSTTVNAFEKVYYCTYQYDECVEASNPIKVDKKNIGVIVEKVIEGEKNFIGFEDKLGTTLQFYVDEIGKVWVEIPAPEEHGSYGKHIENEDMKLIIKKLSEPYSAYQAKLKLEFQSW